MPPDLASFLNNSVTEYFWLQVVVTAVALSLDGSVMCTAEVKLPEEGIGALVCLKFWESESLNKNFSLSTVIYEPHRFYLLDICELNMLNKTV